MAYLTQEQVRWLRDPQNLASKETLLEPLAHPGRYFRLLGLKGNRSSVCEMEYLALEPGQVLTIVMNPKPAGYEEETVYHGTSLAAGIPVVTQGLKVSYGAWRGPNCTALKNAWGGQLPFVYTSPDIWTARDNYKGNTSYQSLGRGPACTLLLEYYHRNRAARIKGNKNASGVRTHEQWLFHPDDRVLSKIHIVHKEVETGTDLFHEIHEIIYGHEYSSRRKRRVGSIVRRVVEGTQRDWCFRSPVGEAFSMKGLVAPERKRPHHAAPSSSTAPHGAVPVEKPPRKRHKP